MLFGGTSNSVWMDDTWTFDGTSWTEVPVSNPPPARDFPGTATLGNEVVLFGGGPELSDTWTFDGTAWTQLSVSNPPLARESPAMAVLP